jgi:catechol 2,3-dioxygenase-like lactoylglutathione lyase family enzyme
MLANSPVATRLPAKDLERARRFYRDKLRLEPVEERPGGLRYRCGDGSFAVFESAGGASGDHTQMGCIGTAGSGSWARSRIRKRRPSCVTSNALAPPPITAFRVGTSSTGVAWRNAGVVSTATAMMPRSGSR